MTAISNEEELVQGLWAQGKTADEIAGIVDIDIFKVHEYLWRPF
jgi:DNA-binding CsgD family transcriptional regulator